MPNKPLLICAFCLTPMLTAQDQLKPILDRLDKIEQENRALRSELLQLRIELGRAKPDSPLEAPGIGERMEVQESRTAELAQTKVEASSRFPISITGMALFNAFHNSEGGGGSQYPTTASEAPSAANGGGSFRQSILGFRFQGPRVAGGGRVSGSLYTDFWAGSGSSLNQLLRIRTATIEVDWKNTTLIAGQEKPLISPREPMSIAQVGVSPLTGAGNPWLWQPQVRIEQRLALGESAGLRAQGALFQTSESRTEVPDDYTNLLDPSRPGYQGRFELWKNIGGGGRLEIASGFHLSTSRAAGYSIPSRIFSLDWMFKPAEKIDFSGLFFNGRNIAPLGALRQGFILTYGDPKAVRTRGGYGQLAYRPTSRLSFHAFTGQQDDRNEDLLPGRIGKNLLFGGNVMYRLAPNVILSFERAGIRTSYIGAGIRKVVHYDLALAYQF
ncbi:MAG: hypothetical protein IH602_07540 [Bryobacteraceae bacterium]|nr:hypothetical protein [Bryobacteraceae bacterium]